MITTQQRLKDQSLRRLANKIEENFMIESNHSFVDFLSKCSSFEFHTILRAMKSSLSPTSLELTKQYPSEDDVPEPNTPRRKELAEKSLKLLQWYGSNAILYVTKKVFSESEVCYYHQILRDTAKTLNRLEKRKNRRKLPKVASVEEWENLVCSFLLASSISGKSRQDIAEMFEEAGLDLETAKVVAKKFGPGGVVGASLPVLVKILGKKTVTILIEQIIVRLTYKRIGREAAIQMAKRLLKKAPQKTFAKIASSIGWILLASDAVFFFISPARRITVPTVSMISAFRSLDRLESMDEKSDLP